MKYGDDAEPGDGNQDSDQHTDGKPAGNLNAANVQIRQNTEHQAGARPLGVSGQPGKIKNQIVHDQNAVETVQKKCADPVPPAALESPEVAEGVAAPAIETALHRKNAVQFGGGVGHGNAPEERNEGEEDQRHAGAGLRKDVFVTERTAGGVAVEEREQRDEANRANGVFVCWSLGWLVGHAAASAKDATLRARKCKDGTRELGKELRCSNAPFEFARLALHPLNSACYERLALFSVAALDFCGWHLRGEAEIALLPYK